MIIHLKKLIRYIKFHLIYKKRYINSPGIPSLCSIIGHPFHESKFETQTCEALKEFFLPQEIFVPSQHKFATKFDFIIPKVAIIEPHGIWSNRPGENSYLDYYNSRKDLASIYKELKKLPMVIVTNLAELNTLKSYLSNSNNSKYAFNNFILHLLEKYSTNSYNYVDRMELKYRNSKYLIILSLLGWSLAVILGITLLLL